MASTVVDGQMWEALVSLGDYRHREVGPVTHHTARPLQFVEGAQSQQVVAVVVVLGAPVHTQQGVAHLLREYPMMSLSGHHGLDKQRIEALSPNFPNLSPDL